MSEIKSKGAARRILLTDENAVRAAVLIDKLRENSCRIDASRLVNFILEVFFDKYEDSEFKNIHRNFFDKKSYLKKLIINASEDELDSSIQKYLSQSTSGRKRGRKPRRTKTQQPDEVEST